MFTFPNTSHFLSYCKNIIHLKNENIFIDLDKYTEDDQWEMSKNLKEFV